MTIFNFPLISIYNYRLLFSQIVPDTIISPNLFLQFHPHDLGNGMDILIAAA